MRNLNRVWGMLGERKMGINIDGRRCDEWSLMVILTEILLIMAGFGCVDLLGIGVLPLCPRCYFVLSGCNFNL